MVSARSLSYIRFLEFVFLPITSRADMHAQRQEDWERVVDASKNKLNLPALTLRVHVSDYTVYRNVPDCRRHMTKDDLHGVVSAYAQLLKPLWQLRERGLCRLFAHLAHPMSWMPQRINGSPEKRARMENYRIYMEQAIERAVMGKDYESKVAGKASVKKSEWEWEIQLRACMGWQ